MSDDFNVYKTIVHMRNVKSITVALNLPPNTETSNIYFEITRIVARGNTNIGIIHLASNALTSNKILNTKNGTYNILNTFILSTSNTISRDFMVDENTLGIPLPSTVRTTNSIDFTLMGEDYLTTGVTDANVYIVDFEVNIWKKK